MCSTGWGLQGHSCPITHWFINLLQPACMRSLFCCVGCYLQPERQAVCISGYTSLGCVWGNEMALFVMYLPSTFAEACLCIHLVISPFLPRCINWQKEWEGDCWSRSLIVLYFHHSHLTAEDDLVVVSPYFFMFLTPTFLLLVHHVHFQMDQLFADPRKKTKKFNLAFSLFLWLPHRPSPVPISLSPVQYQMEMMRSLRHVNIDHLHVGWYQSTFYGSFVSRALLDSQFSYQHAIEESVVLIYGKY